jgi:hypothetical protein
MPWVNIAGVRQARREDAMAQNSDHLRKLLRGELLEVGVAVFIMAILFCLTISVGLFFNYI